jgi:hypothetical protein
MLAVLQPPVAERLDDRAQAFAFVSEVIFEPGWVLAVLLARDQAARLQRLEPRGQRVGRDSDERLLKVLKTTGPLVTPGGELANTDLASIVPCACP